MRPTVGRKRFISVESGIAAVGCHRGGHIPSEDGMGGGFHTPQKSNGRTLPNADEMEQNVTDNLFIKAILKRSFGVFPKRK